MNNNMIDSMFNYYNHKKFTLQCHHIFRQAIFFQADMSPVKSYEMAQDVYCERLAVHSKYWLRGCAIDTWPLGNEIGRWNTECFFRLILDWLGSNMHIYVHTHKSSSETYSAFAPHKHINTDAFPLIETCTNTHKHTQLKYIHTTHVARHTHTLFYHVLSFTLSRWPLLQNQKKWMKERQTIPNK